MLLLYEVCEILAENNLNSNLNQISNTLYELDYDNVVNLDDSTSGYLNYTPEKNGIMVSNTNYQTCPGAQIMDQSTGIVLAQNNNTVSYTSINAIVQKNRTYGYAGVVVRFIPFK